MRTLTLLPLLALLAGCTDALGVGDECEAEMGEVRDAEGTPDDFARGFSSERWIYDSGPGASYYYDFDWSGGTCVVTGPVTFVRIGVDPPPHAHEPPTAPARTSDPAVKEDP